METPEKLPPIIQYYLDEQKRKKKKERNIIIAIVTIVFLLLGYISNKFDPSRLKDKKVKKIVKDSVNTQKSLIDHTSIDSISFDTIKNNGKTGPQLSEEDQRDKVREGEFNLESYVRDNMNDPDSYERVYFDYSYKGSYFIIVLKFRGKNSFGAKVVNYIKAKTDLEGNIIEVLNGN